jgi:predicted nucleic acid-binding protein
MAEPRIVVPDTSILIDALFETSAGIRAKRARQFLAAVLNGSVVCKAPGVLWAELVTVAFDFRSGVRRHGTTPEIIDNQLELFLAMKIVYIPSHSLARRAIELCQFSALSPTDSWYLAAAEVSDAELWISHEHADGFTARARAVYGDENVFTLERNDFYKPKKRRI